jgi:hypothetical protein
MSKVSDKKLDEIYAAIDALMRVGAWNFLDELFTTWETRVWRTDIDILLAYATASYPAKSNIPSRKFFMSSCLRIHPKPELWKGLT